MKDNVYPPEDCKKHIMSVYDAMDLLGGKWKISIIATLVYHTERRFSDMLSDVKGISNKMLSKELKDLEMNKIILRTVLDTRPITVVYTLTEYGQELTTVIQHLADWGVKHRRKIVEEF